MTSAATTKSKTQSLIMDAAERLIAEHGLNGVSNRAIMAEAGVSASALHYHFHSREGLIEALVVRYGHIPTQRRLQMVRRLEEQGLTPCPAEIVDIIVDPFVFLLEQKGEVGRRFLRFVARLQSDRTYSHREVEYRHFPEIIDRLEAWTREACPGVPEDERDLRMTIMIDTVLQNLSNADFMTREWRGNEQDENLRRRVVQLKTFLMAGLSAPATKTDARI